MQLRDVVRTLWRRRLILLGVAVLVVAASVLFLSGQEEVYEARAPIAVLPDPDNPQLVPFYGQAVEVLLPTYAQLIESESFLDGVADTLPFETSGAELRGSVFADPAANRGVLYVVAQTGDPQRTAQIAQATAEEFVAQLADNRIVTLRQLDDARPPSDPIAPQPSLVVAAGIAVGLALGVGAALAWERLFARIDDAAELAAASQLPVLGVIPNERALRKSRRVVVGESGLFALEERLRAIRTNLLFSTSGTNPGPILVTGLNPGDGKSTVAANLAVIIGELGFSVLLVDADVHRPVQHEIFGVSNNGGLSSLVRGETDAASLPVATRHPHVRLVPAGQPLENRAEELSLYLKHLPQLASLADIVLVDSPPLGAADEVLLLASFSGSVVLLVRAGSASQSSLAAAVESLDVLGATVLGTVLTMASDGADAASAGEYYRYRYRSGPGEDAQPPRPSNPT